MGDNKYEGVRAASETSIEIDFRINGQRCRERIDKPPTPRNLAWASNLRGKILAEGDKFDYVKSFPNSKRAARFALLPGDAMTIGAELKRWLIAAEVEMQHSSWLEYKYAVINHLVPAFGHFRLTELKRKHVKEWVATIIKERNISRKRVINLLAPLRALFNEALGDDDIDYDPLAGWKVKVRQKLRNEEEGENDTYVDPFRPEEISAILAGCRNEPERNMFRFAFWTGMRPSEYIALRWKDIDWVGEVKKAHVKRVWVRGAYKVPKTRSSIRGVELLPEALAALKAQKAHTFLAGDLVFLNPAITKPWDVSSIRDHWIAILKKAGVQYRNPYQARHTYASMMLSAHENPVWVAKQLGHINTQMIFKIYVKWIPGDNTAGQKAHAKFAPQNSGGQLLVSMDK